MVGMCGKLLGHLKIKHSVWGDGNSNTQPVRVTPRMQGIRVRDKDKAL